MSYASLSGARVVSGHLTVSTYGAAVADVVLADEGAVPEACSLTIANLTMALHVHRQAAFAGQRSARLVGGAGGWRREVPARAYHSPGGIPISMVLADAAREVGEKIVVANDASVGTYYVREAAPAARTLRQLAGRRWWIDPAGVTHVGPRPPTTVRSEFLAASHDGSEGRYSIATEDLAAWLPGATFSNSLVPATVVSSVSVTLEQAGKMRVEVLAAGDDRLLGAWRQLVRAEDPDESYRGVWEYSVASTTGGTFDGHPTASAVPLPPAVRWPLRGGIPGMTSSPTAGSTLLVAFVNGDPARPIVLGYDTSVPDVLGLDAADMRLGAGLGRVLREGDTLSLTGVQSGGGATGVIAAVTIGLGSPPAPSRVQA